MVTTGHPMSVELGPGMIGNIYDGIQRPLEEILKKTGDSSLPRGVEVPPIDPEQLWTFTPVARAGDRVVLCSDGLFKTLPAAKMQQILSRGRQGAAQGLDEHHAAGDPDPVLLR